MAKLTMLEALRKTRELVRAGTHDGLFEAVHALKSEASGPTRDCVYYALMETASAGGGSSFASLSRPGEGALALLDATIMRLTATTH